jgi:hypothetical protein
MRKEYSHLMLCYTSLCSALPNVTAGSWVTSFMHVRLLIICIYGWSFKKKQDLAVRRVLVSMVIVKKFTFNWQFDCDMIAYMSIY